MDDRPTPLHGLNPEELIARAMQTARPSAGAAAWLPPEPEELARLLPQYRVEKLLGHGGMGAVYKGWQAVIERPVAIKLLPAEVAADQSFVSRFIREARTLAHLQHPGIVGVYDFGQTTEGHLYFVMEFVEGTDLQRVLRGPGLTPAQALALISQICDALQYAHARGVVHRDIKPANVLLTAEGRAKVADFGLARAAETEEARLTQSLEVMGTPAYMAPEQHSGRADHRADIFALGVMLYEMLTGQLPRGAFTPPSQKVLVDVRIDGVVLKALQEVPERRYQQAGDMKTDVERIGAATPRAPTRGPARPRARWAMRAGLGLALLAGGYLILADLRRPARPLEALAKAAKPATAATAGPAGVPAPASPGGVQLKMLVDVDFAKGLNGFPEVHEAGWQLALVDGEYQMLCHFGGLGWTGQPALQELHLTGDLDCEVRARILSKAPEGGWGLGLMDPRGIVTGVFLKRSGQIGTHYFPGNSPPDWASSAAVRPGAEVNVLRVEARGPRLRVYANGQLVFERAHPRPQPDTALSIFSFGDAPPQDVRLQSIKVWSGG